MTSPAAAHTIDPPDEEAEGWVEANQRHLASALREVCDSLARHVGTDPVSTRREPTRRDGESWTQDRPPALDVLCTAFGLTPFERDVLLLCAGVELDASTTDLCAAARGDGAGHPTFGLALAALPAAHWSALTPDAPLRRWRLVDLPPRGPLTSATIRIDEHVLHYLAGLAGSDPKLTGIVSAAEESAAVTVGQQPAAHSLADLWKTGGTLPVLTGADRRTRISVAAHAAADLGLQLALLDAGVIPTDPTSREELARLLEREGVLSGTAFLFDGDDDTTWSGTDAVTGLTMARTAVTSQHPPPLHRRSTAVVNVPRPTADEQRALWREHLDPDFPIEPLVATFDLDAASIHDAARASQGDVTALWAACRALDRADLSSHATLVESDVGWDDLVLPPAQRQTLKLLTAHARHRVTVYDDWGLRMGRATGLGSTAVFGGPSGTGKTFAAEVIAGDLGLDLFRVDLSAVVSKYVGETEKNLRRVFDAADHGAAVLLFDEADALFGKRTEVKDSHDRYANVEVSYLLQRMEAYRGLAILTTNMADAIDTAFLRRVRFVVTFPFPDRAMQRELWVRAFPARTPTEDLDLDVLAGLDMAGGTIRNVAVNAAFLAADADEPVRMSHVIQAARIESAKLGQPMAARRWGVPS